MPPKTNEDSIVEIVERVRYVEFLRGVPVELPSETKELLRSGIRKALTEKDKQREEAVAEARRECHKLSIGKVVNECEEMEELYKKDRLPRIALEDLKFRIIRRVTFEALTPPTN